MIPRHSVRLDWMTWARFALLALPAALLPAVARAGEVIVVSTTIQAAVDAASPGDTVLVPPGTDRESVLVKTSPITIRGRYGAGTGTGNCFAENIFQTEFPEGITELFPCS